MTYPKVLSEDETLDRALAGACIARYGDGELNLALRGDCIFQKHNAVLGSQLRKILLRPRPNLLVCIPNIEAPTKKAWGRYGEDRYTGLYDQNIIYGSSFISRPDSAPWIDRPDYWEKLAGLWRDQDVVLVRGTGVSLTADQLTGARSVREVIGPGEDAWRDVEVIDAEIGSATKRVILCLGPTATVLAHRLSKRGLSAVDIGHVGLYLRHVGAYAITPGELCSDEYRAQLRGLHARERWGEHGNTHAETVVRWAHDLGAVTLLDYGCGCATLGSAVHRIDKGIKVQIYDPGVVHRDGLPKPSDLIVATDVLEHVEPAKVPAVLRHIFLLAGKGAFFTISCAPAKETLPDGRNAHLSIRPPDFWLEATQRVGFTVSKSDTRKGVRIWAKK